MKLNWTMEDIWINSTYEKMKLEFFVLKRFENCMAFKIEDM